MDCIRPLTPEALRTQAQQAAAQHVPLREANHYEPGSELWVQFNRAYGEAETRLHARRQRTGAERRAA